LKKVANEVGIMGSSKEILCRKMKQRGVKKSDSHKYQMWFDRLKL